MEHSYLLPMYAEKLRDGLERFAREDAQLPVGALEFQALVRSRRPDLDCSRPRSPHPEPYRQLVTAYGSHGISYVDFLDMGCMPDLKGVVHRTLRDESFGGILHRQEVAYG